MAKSEILEKKMKLSQSFNPGAPISKISLFAGRLQQLSTVINAINQTGQHVIIYGERGVGKTSLAIVLSDLFEEQSKDKKWLRYARVNCDAGDDFTSVWRKVFRELSIVYQRKEIGFTGEITEERASLEGLIGTDPAPEDIRYILEELGGHHIIVIDEFDRANKEGLTSLMADTIKAFSDHLLNTTLIIVGVADAVDELIEEHLSIERSLVQVHMPRMSTEEMEQIVINGLERVDMTITTDARDSIVRLSQGLPHYAHLLALHASQNAVDEERDEVNINDVNRAISQSVENAQQTIQRKYHQATSSPRKTLYPQVLLACSLANTDDLGYFAASDVRKPLSIIMGKEYDIPAFSRHLNDFCETGRGPVLIKTGVPRRFRFRFINPLIQPYVIMKGIADNLIDHSNIERLMEK